MNKNLWILIIATFLISAFGFAQSIEAWNERARDNMNEKNYAAAIENYSQLIKFYPVNAAAYFDRGFVKSLLKDYAGAITDFNKAVTLDSTNSDNYYLRGNAKFVLKDFKGSFNDYTIALSLDPNNADVHYYKGLVAAELKHYKLAIEEYKKAIQLHSDHTREAFGNSAWANARLHRYKRAKRDCEKAKQFKLDGVEDNLSYIPQKCWCYFHVQNGFKD